ncbi:MULTISPECIES: LysR family transcriptional regulator [unclassified Kitasatospora]|uniref:LysR family transcriptional regulator n=1 Tax=unclassified Kitasatospora TaxID=2633591 RepID=UPI000710F209|nr:MULTISPECIES: LysR family transcriptional regulator [unclassified Kitasatospora]KQV18757.1 LysR family transcriptional regulator [Kitasatospora sp. Root107]KRB74738.1 LysR family transcriptional regulator [Kitasatospora sp. Root187]
MDLDLVRVRAFVMTAEHLHFGRAAQALSLSQQGLSKRIARLEEGLGVALFERGAGGVGLTPAGIRFLGPARALLAAGEAAVAAAREEERPVRLDVWGHLFAPLRTVREALDDVSAEALHAEVGPGRDLPAVAAALLRGDADAGFGRYHPFGDRRDEALAHRLVRLEPVDAILAADHPLARSEALRPTDLTASRLVLPAAAGRLDFLRRFAEQFAVPMLPGEANLGFDHLLERIRNTPGGFTLFPAEVPLPEGSGLVAVPLVEPTPLYAWSLLWPRRQAASGVAELVRGFARSGRRRRWLEYRPGRDWLPEADQEQVRAL